MPNCNACDNPAVVQWQRLAANGTDYAPVYACATHGISIDLAALLHANNCAAPTSACNCGPVPYPASATPDPVTLPNGW